MTTSLGLSSAQTVINSDGRQDLRYRKDVLNKAILRGMRRFFVDIFRKYLKDEKISPRKFRAMNEERYWKVLRQFQASLQFSGGFPNDALLAAISSLVNPKPK